MHIGQKQRSPYNVMGHKRINCYSVTRIIRMACAASFGNDPFQDFPIRIKIMIQIHFDKEINVEFIRPEKINLYLTVFVSFNRSQFIIICLKNQIRLKRVNGVSN